jgi:hypothetical protein
MQVSIARIMGMGHGMAVLAIGLVAVFGTISLLMNASRKDALVVYQTDEYSDAVLCTRYLRDHGIEAVAFDRALPGVGQVTADQPLVLVPRDQYEHAATLLAERAEYPTR